MSKWKQQIDFELGNDRKFNQALEQKISQKAYKQRSKNFTYPITFVSACFIAFILFFTWPENTPQQQQTSGDSLILNNLVKTGNVSAFYVSYFSSKDNQFLARANTLALGVEKFSSKEAIQVMMEILDQARLVDQSWSSYTYDYDVVIKFNSGKEKKVKIYEYSYYFGILDLETNLFYKVEGDYVEVFRQIIDKGEPPLLLLTVLCIISYFLLCVNIKDKAPASIKIFLIFIAMTVVVFLLQEKNIILSIWLPVAILLGLALYRLVKLQQEDYPIDKLGKLKLYTILLIVMWSISFVTQLIGGIL